MTSSSHTWTDEAIDRTLERYKKEINNAKNLKEVEKYPAYQSVLIHFDSKPSTDTIDFMKNRVYEFVRHYKKPLNITGFRMKESKKTEDATNI